VVGAISIVSTRARCFLVGSKYMAAATDLASAFARVCRISRSAEEK